MSLLDLIRQGGISLVPLGICSVLVIAVILERLWAFARTGGIPGELIRRVESLLQAGAWGDAVRMLEGYDNPFARIVRATLLRKPSGKDELADTLTLACDAEIAAITKPLPVLGTIGNVAPFIGLFGTVIGIMKAFQDVAEREGAGAAVVSAGIAEALIATAAGLGVGIVAVVANNWFNASADSYRLTLERFSTEWSYRLMDLLQMNTATDDTTVLAGQPEDETIEEPVV